MDDWTYPHPDVDLGSSQPMLLDQVCDAAEDRLGALEEAAARAEADRRAVDLEQARIWDSVDDGRNILDVPLPFEAPDHTSFTH